MKPTRLYIRTLALASLAMLAACQSVPVDNADTAKSLSTAQAAPTTQATSTAEQAKRQGAPVAVFLVDRQIRPGWTVVSAPGGTVYVNPQPFLTRTHLREVKAGAAQNGQGWLALALTPAGAQSVNEVTTANPNKGLALVIGRTLMPILPYQGPITDGTLLFRINTQENAIAAARAIAGVPVELKPQAASE